MNLIIKKENNYELLKIVAMITMLIDHVGFLLFPEYLWIRMIGRIALPLFMYQYLISFDKTSDRKKGLKLVWLFVFISQIPYFCMYNFSIYEYTHSFDYLMFVWNVFLPLALGYTLLYITYEWKTSGYNKIIPIILILLMTFIVPMDYDWFIPITLFIMYFFKKHFPIQLLIFAISTFIFVSLGQTNIIQYLGIIAFALGPILYFVKLKFILHKYIHYLFYPVHIALLVIIKIFLF